MKDADTSHRYLRQLQKYDIEYTDISDIQSDTSRTFDINFI